MKSFCQQDKTGWERNCRIDGNGIHLPPFDSTSCRKQAQGKHGKGGWPAGGFGKFP